MTKPSSPQVISLAEAKEQVWRNGGGTTRELLIRTKFNSDDWQYRISVALVNADGPFSHFESTQRHFCVLAGNGVDLTVDGAPSRITKDSNALSFSGEAKVDCRLVNGATSDLNFMVRTSNESKPLSGMIPLKSGMPQPLSDASSSGMFSLQDGLCQWFFDGQTFELSIAANQLVWFDTSPEQITFTAIQAAVSTIDQQQVKVAWSMFAGRTDP